jgi:flagellar protein FlbD
MIEVTRTNTRKVVINVDLIEFIESTPDIVITLTSGTKILVKESIKELIDKVIEYKRKCNFFYKIEEVKNA